MCQVSCVMCHVSGVMCQVSGVTCHDFFFSSFFGHRGVASRWRVNPSDEDDIELCGGSVINGDYPVQFIHWYFWFCSKVFAAHCFRKNLLERDGHTNIYVIQHTSFRLFAKNVGTLLYIFPFEMQGNIRYYRGESGVLHNKMCFNPGIYHFRFSVPTLVLP